MSRPWQEYCDSANWHEAANIFPLMPDDEIQKLADDIKANGQKNAIILIDDKVLDGRNRLLACKLVGVTPDFQSRNPEKLGSPVSWVLSQNLHRRQLTATQRAFVAVEAEKLFAIEAKQRQTAGQNNETGRAVKAKLPELGREKGQAREKAAARFEVSPRYVQDAKAVAARSPEVAAQAIAGKVTMAEAKRVTHLATTRPAEPSKTVQLREWFSTKYKAFKLRPSERAIAGIGGSMGRYDLMAFNLTPAQVKEIGELLGKES